MTTPFGSFNMSVFFDIILILPSFLLTSHSILSSGGNAFPSLISQLEQYSSIPNSEQCLLITSAGWYLNIWDALSLKLVTFPEMSVVKMALGTTLYKSSAFSFSCFSAFSDRFLSVISRITATPFRSPLIFTADRDNSMGNSVPSLRMAINSNVLSVRPFCACRISRNCRSASWKLVVEDSSLKTPSPNNSAWE